MPTSEWRRIEAVAPFLAALAPGQRKFVYVRRLPSRTHLFVRGDRPAFVFVVIEGEVRLVRPSALGSEIVLQRTRRGVVAEASFDQPRYHCDGVVAGTAAVAALPLAVFREALGREEFRHGWLGHMAQELRRSRAMCERLSLRTARERVIHFLDTEGEDGACRLAMTRKAWAGELGLTHEALYRTLARLLAEGVIAATPDGHGFRLVGGKP